MWLPKPAKARYRSLFLSSIHFLRGLTWNKFQDGRFFPKVWIKQDLNQGPLGHEPTLITTWPPHNPSWPCDKTFGKQAQVTSCCLISSLNILKMCWCLFSDPSSAGMVEEAWSGEGHRAGEGGLRVRGLRTAPSLLHLGRLGRQGCHWKGRVRRQFFAYYHFIRKKSG